ncbi:RNA polymerase subunit sigma [Loktanella sp. D2R18]|uniref:RNA polymerase sigma factor n=1 Tax=Rhodobacterales TaxID=204455 RepID=UPI000DE87ED8|nr:MULTISPECIES: sigma-70 family RNA polymerase sigma factor [Rhodobacterales]MDO6588827.1 sigma-70 family RNA polymerase sigma factor [Yoonia sp. 1_MG-2023]RBW41942.1 RNA polymerase subunit sigma [Loktanella sp. D2R18]
MSNFQQQISDCMPDLWRYAFALTRNRDAADDLLQDAVERAWRKRAMWEPTGTVKAWAMKVLLNTYRTQLRAPARRHATAPLEDIAQTVPAADTLDDQLALAETARAMATLPEEQREALLSVVVGGLSYKDAAATLDIPIGTLMSRLGRARAALKAAMQPVESPVS